METLAYLARQPILDREGKIFAYELLFRDSPSSEKAVVSSDVLATAQVLENVLNNIGVPRLVGDHKAFVNCSRDMLLNNLFGLLNPKSFVLEILEDVDVDEQVIKAVQRYRAMGFELAIDDFIYNEDFLRRFEPLFPYISYVKMDLVDNNEQSTTDAATFFKSKGIKLLAEKVETDQTFKKCLSEGYDLFQGFFFAKPELVTGRKVDATTSAIIKILLLLRTHPTLDVLSTELNANPSVAQNLLKYVNTKAGTGSRPMKDIREAIIWVGMQNIQDWLILMLYARPELGVAPQSSPLFQNASHRAKFLELLVRFMSGIDDDMPAKAFMVGLLSRMDALVGTPLADILRDFPTDDEIRMALLEREGKLGILLRLAEAMELDDKASIVKFQDELSISTELLNRCICDAYSWTHDR